MEGRINLFECDDKSGKRPHYRGFLTIDGADHEFALWPAKSGRGFSGTYKPKQERQQQQAEPEPRHPADEIPF